VNRKFFFARKVRVLLSLLAGGKESRWNRVALPAISKIMAPGES
jgi:hypothetical protein